VKELKRTWIHLALLFVAAVLAYVESRPKDAADKPLAPGELEVWKGKPEDVSRIAFEDDKKRVILEKQSDKVGLWYLGKVEPLEGAKVEADGANPHKTVVEAATFASASVAKELVKSLSTLRAKRSFGPIGDERMKEFGFDKPEGTLRVTVSGKERALLVGASTAGSSTRYVRDLESKAVYVIDGSPVSDLKAGTARLAERNQHEWKWNEPDSITVAAGGKSKRVVRSGTEGRRFWADANASDQNDETSGNWLSKLERLRPTTFLASLPEGATRVVRVEYRTGSDDKGFFELHHRSGEKENPFVIVTENLRLPAIVTRQSVGQLVDDLATLLPGAELPALPKDEGAAPVATASASADPALAASSAPTAAASSAPSAAPAASSDKGRAPPKRPGASK
jgi:hypothetical protein